MKVELHFTEGFDGDPVEVVSEGVLLGRLTLTTRLQIGLAEIMPVEADGDIRVMLPERRIAVQFPIRSAEPYVEIRLVEDELVAIHLDRSPGYL